MGYSIAWVAVRGLPEEAAIARLALSPTGQLAQYAEEEVGGRLVPDDWFLVVARGCDHRIIADSQLARLQVDCEVIACSVEEHVMYSSSELWSNGKRTWRVAHDAQRSIDHLAAEGDLPGDFAATRTLYAGRQQSEGRKDAAVDCYFEIPLMLAKVRVGFKHDEAFESAGTFQVYSDAGESGVKFRRKPWWRLR
jgi:hypothetical protein